MKNRILLGMLVVVLLASGCMATPNPLAGTASQDAHRAGFVDGVGQGVISIPMIFWRLGGAKEGIYELRNNGLQYDAGFVLGLGLLVFFGMLISEARGAKKR